jgi:hypothetical protein
MADEKTITITPPTRNTAADWNATVAAAAAEAGVDLPVRGATAVAAPAAKKEDEPVLYEASVTINGKEITFRDADPANVIKQMTVALEAAQPAPVAAAVEEPKPAFTEAELFDISLKIQKGDVTGLDTYIEKSGVLDRWLESKGLKVEDLKAQTTESKSAKLTEEWKTATSEYLAKVKAGESDYPGGEQNTRLMGYMIAELGLGNKPSVESFDLAYAELKKRNMVFPVTKQDPAEKKTEEPAPKKAATSSTAVGTHGGRESTAQGAPTGKVELDITQLTPRQYTESYNELIKLGYKKEQIVIKQ